MSLSPAFARILFAEDDDLVRQVAEETLRDASYNVVSVADGEDALAALPRVQPNLIVSDVRMPRCNGFDFLRRVRNDREFAHTPFIILSAKAEIADQRMGMSLGADDYVVKPYHPEDLLKAINLRLARAAAVREALTQQHRFLAHTLPHELRNPLTGILAYADLITQTGKAGRTLTSAELADYGENLSRSGLRLLRTAENFSLWATLESQQENVRALGTIIRSARAITGEQISALCRGVETEYGRLGEAFVRIAPATVSVRPHGLDQVIRHLLDNAFKFSFPKSRVGGDWACQSASLRPLHHRSRARHERGAARPARRSAAMRLGAARAPGHRPGVGERPAFRPAVRWDLFANAESRQSRLARPALATVRDTRQPTSGMRIHNGLGRRPGGCPVIATRRGSKVWP